MLLAAMTGNCCLHRPNLQDEGDKSYSRPHVGVVGAGLSGLRSADVLLQRGFRVTILEARDRLGGRVHQVRLPNGHLIDMGANWVHGTEDNPMLNLAKETDTAVEGFDHPPQMFDEEGEPIPADEARFFSVMMWEIIAEAFEVSNKHGADIDPVTTLLDFFRDQVPLRIPEAEEGYERKRRILLQLSEVWGAFVGSSVGRQSLKFFWLEECLDGGRLPRHAMELPREQADAAQRTSSAPEPTTAFFKGLLNLLLREQKSSIRHKCWIFLESQLQPTALSGSRQPTARFYTLTSSL